MSFIAFSSLFLKLVLFKFAISANAGTTAENCEKESESKFLIVAIPGCHF